MNQSLLSFNNGEVTPYLRHRIDFEKTGSSAETLRNFLAMPYGGVIKRPGLQHVATTAAPAGPNSRLLPFLASDGTRYLLHFTPDLLTIYGTDGSVKDSVAFMDGYTWPAEHDWENSVRDLHIEQVNDVAFITHPGTFPLRLSRLTDTDWVLEFLPFRRPPLNDENPDETQTFTVASNPVAPTWAPGIPYTPGQKVFTNSEWYCILGHTSTVLRRPPSGQDWRKYWRSNFYEAGDPVTILSDDRSEVPWGMNYKFYPQWTVFTTGSDQPEDFSNDEPGYYDGPQTNFLGRVFIEDRQIDATFTIDNITTDSVRALGGWSYEPYSGWDPNIPEGSYYLLSGVIYRCTVAHSKTDEFPDPGDEHPYVPGYGPHWADVWEVVVPLDYNDVIIVGPEFTQVWFQINDLVSSAGRVFRCILAHQPQADREPGVGGFWDLYWVEISRVVPAFASGPFSPGQYFMIAPQRMAEDFQVETPATGTAISDQIVVQGAWNFFTYGTWFGQYELQRSVNNGKTWEVQRTWESKGDRNIADSGIEDEPVIMRLRFTKSAGTPLHSPRGVLVPDNTAVRSYALMDTYVGPDAMTGFALTSMVSGNTSRWAYGAFNERDGYPRALCLHESRLVFGGTRARPVSLWLSQSDDLDNFETGPEASDGMFATLALSAASPIRWLASQRRLFVGTTLGEWAIGSETSDAPLKGENFRARQYTGIGTLALQPLKTQDGLFFVERKGTRLRDYGFSYEREGYEGTDLSRLAEHLTQPGVSGMGWQQTREPGLWVVRRDGMLLHFAFSRSENIRAWSRHDTQGGQFLDVAVLPSDDGDDEVYFMVRRGAESHLERFPQHWQAAIEAGTGFHCLDGQEDHPVVAVLSSLPLDLGTGDGTSQARRKRAHKFVLNIFQSAGGTVWNRSEAAAQPIVDSSELRSGWIDIVPDAGHLDDLQLNIRHTAATPFVLRSACIRWQVQER